MNQYRIVLDSGERQVFLQVVREVIELVSAELDIDAPEAAAYDHLPEKNTDGAAETKLPEALAQSAAEVGRALEDVSREAEDFKRWSQQLSQMETVEEVHVSSDPALLRLFPPASHSDPDGAHEFRGLTQKSIADAKLRGLVDVLSDVKRAGDEPIQIIHMASWLRAMTDCRLVLASRLGISTSADAERIDVLAFADEDSPELQQAVLSIEVGDDPEENSFERIRYTAQVYSFFGTLQESLLHVVRMEKHND